MFIGFACLTPKRNYHMHFTRSIIFSPSFCQIVLCTVHSIFCQSDSGYSCSQAKKSLSLKRVICLLQT